MPHHHDRDRDRVRTPARRPGLRAGSVVLGALLVAVAISACTSQEPVPAPTVSSATPTATPTPTPTPTGPVLVPDGSAADNLPLFTAVTAQVWATAEQAQGRAYVDALVAAGFDRGAMQVTEDMTTVANPAESIQFSVKWAEECLVGQVGPATGEPLTLVMSVLPSGACLLGQTRAIDW